MHDPQTQELGWIDGRADDFEKAWKKGQRPSLTQFVVEAPATLRLPLLRELLAIEIYYRLRQGEMPTLEEYRHLAPENTEVLAEVLARRAAQRNSGTVVEESSCPAEANLTHPLVGPRFTWERVHAEGGLGRVWVAHDRELNREVAVKEIHPEHADHPGAYRRFLREAQVTGQLEHPNIVPVYELCSRPEGGRPFYVMRFIRGRTLREAIATYHDHRRAGILDPLELPRLLQAFVGVCNALAYAHSRGVLHRDLKPDNVVLGSFGEVLVLDWGLAKTGTEPDAQFPGTTPLEATPGTTATGQLLGTPGFMAPEQAAGRSDQADARTDIFGLGAILYAILTGQPPHQGDSVTKVLHQASRTEGIRPRQQERSVPPALDAVCARALAYNPEHRYATAGQLAEDVQRWLAEEPVSAYSEPFWHRWARRARRHRAWVIAGLTALLIVTTTSIVAALVTHRQKQLAQQSQSQAECHLYLQRIAAADLHWEAGDLARTNQLLNLCRPEGNRPDLRGWEWDHLFHRSHAEQFGYGPDEEGILALALSPEGHLLASTGVKGTLKIRDFQTGQEIFQVNTGVPVKSMAFSPDNRRLALAAGEEIRVLDVLTGQEVLILRGHGGQVNCVAFRPDGRQLASGSSDRAVRLWDTLGGKLLGTLKGHKEVVTCIAYRPDGQELATASFDKTVRIWEAAGGREVRTLARGGMGITTLTPGSLGSSSHVACLAYSPDGNYLASGHLNGFVTFWDGRGGAAFFTLSPAHRGPVGGLTFTWDNQRLVSWGADDRLVKVWHVLSGQQALLLRAHSSNLRGASPTPDGRMLVTAANDGTVKVWDALMGQDPATLICDGEVCGIAFSPSGDRVATAVSNGNLEVWDLAKSSRVYSMPASMCVAYSPDGRLLAGGRRRPGDKGLDYEVVLWDAATGKEKSTLGGPRNREGVGGHRDLVTGVAFSPDGKSLASASNDGTVRLWDTVSGKEQQVLGNPGEPLRGIAFSPDDRPLRLATAGPGNSVNLWDVARGALFYSLKGHEGPITAVAFSPDGRYVASASSEGTVRLWDPETGGEVRVCRGHTSAVTGVAFAPGPFPLRLASASEDHTVRLWDVATGQEILTLRTPFHLHKNNLTWYVAGPLKAIAFSPDGRRLATGGQNRTLRVWEANNSERRSQPWFNGTKTWNRN